MSKSLTSIHTSLLQERENIDARIQELESQLGNTIISLIRQQNGFKTPFPLLCGALIDTLNAIDSNTEMHSEWQEKGEKFLRSIKAVSRSKRKSGQNKKTIKELNNDHSRAA